MVARANLLLIATGSVVFVIALAATAPASIMAPAFSSARFNVRYHAVEGSVWRGKFIGVSAEHVALGDIEFTLSPLSVLSLSPRAALKFSGGALEGTASAALTGNIHIRDADFKVDLKSIAQHAILGDPVAGVAHINIRELLFTRNGCRKADGRIWTDVFDAPARKYNQTDEFPMSGNAACDGDSLVIALNGEGGPGAASVAITVAPDYSYQITATARPARDDVATALRYFGFEDANGALTFGAAGVLDGVGS